VHHSEEHRVSPAARKKRAWEEFVGDSELLQTYNIRSDELVSLSRVALLGSASTKKDFLFMLNVIRRGRSR